MAIDNEKILKRGYVLYSDFGAVGDGVADDFCAIYEAHEFANANSLPVAADEGATYYIHEFEKSAVIKTDTSFDGARFILDDTGSHAYNNKSIPLFLVERDNPAEIYTGEELTEKFGTFGFDRGATVIPELKGKLVTKSLIRFSNEKHRDFVRFGGNVNSGNARTDCLLIDTDGSVDPSTPIAFAFDEVTKMEIIRTDDKPITVKGGHFKTICCSVVEETEFENKWRGYHRKFKINRTNTTMRDMTHVVTGEPDIPNEGYGRSEDGKLRQSYPYYGFLFFSGTVNSSAINCALCGHTTYYEDKKTSPNPVPQGTYDLVIEYSSHVHIEKITNGVDISDRRYWGLMSSNGAKNMTFLDCSMSRFDAHRGFWNAKLINCKFGQTINVIGGGTLYLENVERVTGDYFIALRGDYGATFEGDIIMKNCRMLCGKNYRGVKAEGTMDNSIRIVNSGFGAKNEKYLDWDFGYTCYMPKTVYIENFYTAHPERTYVFNQIGNEAFDDGIKNKYMLTESVTFKNTERLPMTENVELDKLLSIPVICE